MGYRLALAIALLALAGGCSSGSDERRSERSPVALVLLHDNRLVRISLLRGRVDRVVDLGPRRAGPPQRGEVLALTNDRATALALVGIRIVALDAASLKRRASHRLEPGVRYAGLVVGASGTIYAYGDRRTRSGWQVVVTRVDGSRRTAVVRGAEPGLGVYWGAISADERRLLLSYHGGPDGADWFRVSPRGFEHCEPPRRRLDVRRHPRCLWSASGAGRRHVHGAVAPSGEGFLAATGRSRLIALDGDGRLVDAFDPRTGDAHHLMDFAYDATRGRVVVGSCEGLRAVDLPSGHVREVPRRRPCRETPLAVHGDRVLLARGERLAIVELGRGRTVARMTVPAAPIAAVVADAP